VNQFDNTLKWFVKAGQMPETPEPSARKTAFYIGMQMEELAEKLEAVFGKNNPASGMLDYEGDRFKRGEYDGAVKIALHSKPKDLLDADMDILWVTLGAARAQGADVDGAYDKVLKANWDKFPGGVVTKDANGKVVKPEGWTAPDLMACIHESIRVAA
jgi:predicted HAD superfamily Cof-like phosphohydrolase